MAGLGATQMTITTGANFIPEIWSKEYQLATQANLVAAGLCMRFDKDVMQKGDTIHVPKVSNLTTTTKSANTAVTFQSPTEDKVDINITTYVEASFLIEDNLDAQSQYALAEIYKKKAIYANSKKIDTDVLALYSSVTQTVGTDGVPPTDQQILRAIQYLDDADAPDTERCFVMKPALKNSLLQIDKYVNSDYTGLGDIPVKTGLFGQRYGLLFYVSTNVPAGATGSINIIMHKEAYCAAIQKNAEMKSDYILEYAGTGYVCKSLYGVSVYRAAFGCQVLGN